MCLLACKSLLLNQVRSERRRGEFPGQEAQPPSEMLSILSHGSVYETVPVTCLCHRLSRFLAPRAVRPRTPPPATADGVSGARVMDRGYCLWSVALDRARPGMWALPHIHKRSPHSDQTRPS